MSLRYWIIGGWAVVDVLNVLGLHWLGWPVIAGLLAFAAVERLRARR